MCATEYWQSHDEQCAITQRAGRMKLTICSLLTKETWYFDL